MAHTAVQLLPVTPRSKAYESVLGYVLRLSQDNGYDTPWHVLQHAGLHRDQIIHATTPVAPIAKIVGRPVEELECLAWQRYPKDDPVPPLNKGMPRLLRYLNIFSPKICPLCVAEYGAAEAAWDLKIMAACPVHGVAMATRCPKCHKPLRWYRPALGVCHCGASIASVDTPVSARVVALLSIVRDRLYGDEHLLVDEAACGLPQAALRRMRIDDLLGLLDRIGGILRRINASRRRSSSNCTVEELDDIASVFADWPNGLHALLKQADAMPDANHSTMSLRKRFEWIHWRLFPRHGQDSEHLAFLRKAFINYGMTKGNGVFVDARMLHRFGLKENYSQVVRMSSFARAIGIDPRTAAKFVERGLVTQVMPASPSGYTPIVVEVHEDTPVKNDAGNLPLRAAAKHLDIPVRLLKELRLSGIYRVRHIGRSFGQYHQADLKEMRKSIVDPHPLIQGDLDAGCITIHKAIRSRFGFRGDLAHLIADVVVGKVRPLGRIGNGIRDLVLKESDWLDYLVKHNLAKDDWIPAYRAARLLYCDSMCIASLIEAGHLEGVCRRRSIRVRMKSVAAFAQAYVSGAWIAKSLGTSSRRILRLCKAQGAKMILAGRSTRSSEQLFVARDYLEMLGIRSMPLYDDGSASVETTDAFKEKQTARRLSSPEKLLRYLDGLRIGGMPLPRRAGQSNRAAISNACSFDRNTLYNNAEAASILAGFDDEDRARHNVRRRKSPVIVLREYFDRMNASDRPLPRVGGRLNLKAIANACGFDRNTFYVDAEAKALLGQYAEL